MIRLARDRRARPDTVVPMINVAFLLLVFFLMAAVLAPAAPDGVTPPDSEGRAAEPGAVVVVLDENGRLSDFATADEAPLDGLAGQRVQVLADRALSAAVLAAALRRIENVGPAEITVIARRK